jgi:hypothetical protein
VWFDRVTPTTVYAASVAATATANHLWKSTNSGASWTAIDGTATASNGFPFGIPVHVVQTDPLVATTVYAGTDFGVYVSTNGGTTWARFGTGLPMVAVRDLYCAPNGSFIRAATFGRGVWELSSTPVAPSLDVDGNGTIEPLDLLYFAKYYGTTTATCDFNLDGTVNDTDLGLLIAGL